MRTAFPARPRREIERAVHTSPAGAEFAQGEKVLSRLHGVFSSSNLGCQYLVSPDGWRVFHTAAQPSFARTLNVVAGMVEPVNFMLDGGMFEPEGLDASGFRFSGDSGHVCYFTRGDNGRKTLRIDGEPVGKSYADAGSPVLSADASGWAFAAKIDNEWCVVQNARVGPEFDSIDPDSLSLSDDGLLVGYIGVRGKRRIAVLGDREFPLDNLPTVAVTAEGNLRNVRIDKTKTGRCVVLDDTPGPEFDKIDAASLRFSPDAARFAYSAKKDGKWHLVLDGEIGPAFAEIASDSPSFSPDGRRFAYAACGEKSWLTGKADYRVVLDGSNGPTYASVGGLAFSPDGTRFGHAAQTKKGTALAVDGVEMGCWEALSSLAFSPDSRRHIAIATVGHGTKKCLVIDGKEGPHYKDVGQIAFTPDSRHAVAMAWGVKHSETPASIWTSTGRREGGFLVLDNDYEAKGWIRSAAPSQYNRVYHTEVRIGFAGPSTVYAVSMLVNDREVSFSRVEVECV